MSHIHSPPRSPSVRGRSARSWPPHAVELLEQLWKAGDLSASQIAQRLGVSRNAVLGKVHRLGLSGQRPPPVRPARPRSPPRDSRPKRLAGPTLRRAKPASARSTACGSQAVPPSAGADDHPEAPKTGLIPRLEDLSRSACHWPCGDPKADDFAFCGRRVAGPPYCEAHTKLAYRPGARASLSQLLRLAAGAS